LRINTAKDDAAGLAVRELMRADISVLQQGARNAQGRNRNLLLRPAVSHGQRVR
jgi:hypothetical protein